MVGILLSYWEGPFSGAMLVSGRVPLGGTGNLAKGDDDAEEEEKVNRLNLDFSRDNS